MAQPEVTRGYQLQIAVGDGASPEVFAHPCLINTARSIEGTKTVTEDAVLDCESPGAPAWLIRSADTKSYRVSGSGKMDAAALETWQTFFDSKDPKNVRIIHDGPTTKRRWSGQFHLTSLTLSGDRKELVEVEIELMSTGAVTPEAHT